MTERLSRGQELARWGAVRVRYPWPADRVGAYNRVYRGAELQLALRLRLRPARPNAAQLNGCWIDAGYSLDAPESFPAGACRGEEMEEFMDGVEDDHWIGRALPMQVEVARE